MSSTTSTYKENALSGNSVPANQPSTPAGVKPTGRPEMRKQKSSGDNSSNKEIKVNEVDSKAPNPDGNSKNIAQEAQPAIAAESANSSKNENAMASVSKPAIEEDEFADLEEAPRGGEDSDAMYGDSLDSTWLVGYKGMKLLREAESMIACLLLRRDHPSQPCLWRAFLEDLIPEAPEAAEEGLYEEEAKTEAPSAVVATVEELKKIWKEKNEKPIKPDVLSALCLRFGPAFQELQVQLQEAADSPFKTDMTMLKRAAYDQFSARNVLPTLSISVELDVREIVDWLKQTEATLDLVELQMDRGAEILETMQTEIGSSDLFTDLSKRLGIPGVHGKLIKALCGSAMIHAGLSADMPCPIKVLSSYCAFRATSNEADNSLISSARRHIDCIFRPKAFQIRRCQEFLAVGNLKFDDDQPIENDEDLLRHVRAKVPVLKHLLAIVKTMSKNSAGYVKVDSLRSEIESAYEHLPNDFINLVMRLWHKPETETMVSTEILEAFMCPNEKRMMSVRIRTPMKFGFKVSAKPTYPTEIMYQAAIKQMFAKLKTVGTLKYSSRVPNDVKLYSDAEKRVLIPRSQTVYIGNQVDDGDKVYASSDYIEDLMEQAEAADLDKLNAAVTERQEKAEDRRKLQREHGGSKNVKSSSHAAKSSNATSNASGGKATTGSPSVPAAPGSPRNKPPPAEMKKAKKGEKSSESLQSALDKLMEVSAPIHVPPYPPFPGSLAASHQWGIPLLAKYLRDEVELPQYEQQFLRNEMTGSRFVRMSFEELEKALQFEHPLHGIKLAEHARTLAERVLERAAIQRPHEVEKWGPEHVGGWLTHKADCAQCGYTAFVNRLDGEWLFKILNAKNEDTSKSSATHNSIEEVKPDESTGSTTSQIQDIPEKAMSMLRDGLGSPDEPEVEKALQALWKLIMKTEEDVLQAARSLGTNPDGKGSSRMAQKRLKEIQHKDPIEHAADAKVEEAAAKARDAKAEVKSQDAKAEVKTEVKTEVQVKDAKVGSAGCKDSTSSENAADAKVQSAPSAPKQESAATMPQESETKREKWLHMTPAQRFSHPELEPTDVPAVAETEPQQLSATSAASSSNPEQHAALEKQISELTDLVQKQAHSLAELRASSVTEAQKAIDIGLQPVRQSIQELISDRQNSTKQLQAQLEHQQGTILEHINSLTSKLVTKSVTDKMKSTDDHKVDSIDSKDAHMPEVAADAQTTPSLSYLAAHASVEPEAQTNTSEAAPTSATSLPESASIEDTKKNATAPAVLGAPQARPTGAHVSFASSPVAKEKSAREGDSEVKYTSVGKTMGLQSNRPVQDAAELTGNAVEMASTAPGSAVSTASTAYTDASNEDDRTPDFQKVFERTAQAEIELWKKVVSKYNHKKVTELTVSDTTAQLGRIANLWVRLGMRILDDSRLKPQADDSPTGMDPEEDEGIYLEFEGSSRSPSPRASEKKTHDCSRSFIGALRGMVKSVRVLLLPIIPDIQAKKPKYSYATEENVVDGSNAVFLHETHSKVQTKVRMSESDKQAIAREEARKEEEILAQKMKLVSERQHDYEVAGGLVFVLCLVRRLLDRYPNKQDSAHLLYLFGRLREGTLPLSEISRENFRSLLNDTLRCQIPTWPQFDSICQRFDPDSKGFITASNVVTALRHVNPLTEGLGPGDAQGISLLVLSSAASQLARRGKDMQEAFLDLIFSEAANVGSFADLTSGRDRRKQEHYDQMQEDAEGLDNEKQVELDAKSMKMADETLLVVDLLHELNHPLFEKIQDDKGQNKSKKYGGKHAWAATINMDPAKDRATVKWRRDQESLVCPLQFVEPAPHTIKSACELTTRGLQVFEGRSREEQLLPMLGSVFGTQLLFRVMCLRRHKIELEERERKKVEFESAQVNGDVKSNQQVIARNFNDSKSYQMKLHKSMFLTVPQVSNAIGAIEADMIRLLGMEQARTMLARSDSEMSLEELERLITELTGHAIPYGGVFGLYHSQIQVETYLYHNYTAKTDKAMEVIDKQQEVYNNALADISLQLMTELRGSELLKEKGSKQKDKKSSTVRHRQSDDGKMTTYMRPQDIASSHLLTEMNALVHKQRVDQVAEYLIFLNKKAARRRKLLEASLYLSTAARRLGPGPHPHVPALMKDREDLNLSPSEVYRRAHELQHDIKEDMRQKPDSTVIQMAQRVEQIKLALLKGSIADTDYGLSVTLREVAELESQLLQANEDILGLTESIKNNCKKHMGPSDNPTEYRSHLR